MLFRLKGDTKYSGLIKFKTIILEILTWNNVDVNWEDVDDNWEDL